MTENLMTDNPKLKEKWMAQIQPLWPAIKGSLAQVKKPCIRPQCPACASGQKHPAWLLAVKVGARRTTLYIPEALVGQIKAALHNGRKMEALLQQAALQMVKEHRSQLKKPPKSSLKS